MKFKYDHDPICLYCVFAHKTDEKNVLMCDKRGKVLENHRCRKFKYDLLKRNPRRKETNIFGKFSKEDFEI